MNYAEKTKGVITFHKLLTFIESPAAYNEIYNKLNGREEEREDYFVVGQAIEDYLYGKQDKYEVVARRGKEAEKIQLTNAMGETVQKSSEELLNNPFGKITGEKTRLEIKYSDFMIGGEIDELSFIPWKYEEKSYDACITDIKTCASFESFEKLKEQYIQQLSWYQFIVQAVKDIPALRIAGKIKLVTKDSIPMSKVYLVTPLRMLDYRNYLLTKLDELIDMEKTNTFPEITWEECLKFPSVYHLKKQEKLIII